MVTVLKMRMDNEYIIYQTIVKQSNIREKHLAKHREADENYTDSVGTPKTS